MGLGAPLKTPSRVQLHPGFVFWRYHASVPPPAASGVDAVVRSASPACLAQFQTPFSPLGVPLSLQGKLPGLLHSVPQHAQV